MPVLATVQRTSAEDARQFAYRILKLSILELLLRPGEKLNEAEIAVSLRMSRTPVHDVLGRLARESLVEAIPQRGAFVARIFSARASHAAWVQAQAGVAVLEIIYTAHLQRANLTALQKNLACQEMCLSARNFTQMVRHVSEFHRELYELAHLDMAWESMQRACADYRRLLQLCSEQPGFAQSTLLECRCIADGLAARDNDRACRALNHQFARVEAMLPILQKQYPELFAENNQENEER